MRVLTVGHSTHSLDGFVALLQEHHISAIADVRSNPFSRYTPQFNMSSLRTALRRHEIQYAFLGRELGARSSDPNCYVDGRVQYARLAETDLFRDGIRRILSGAAARRIALMCAEKDPLDCHRALLVTKELVSQGVQVDHVLADGTAESHYAAMLRLLDKLDMQRTSLLRSTEELIADALARQAERIAYVDPKLAALSNRSA
ncbi:MAG: DUF488 domain-containing protein [Actinomycetota bacterium]|nr:DUF488 domain-containing protein [Actinomycetota bacterium]